MIPFHLAVDRASELAAWLWTALMIVWLVLWAGMKRAKKLETPFEMLQHALPVVLGFWLLFGSLDNWGWLNYRLLPKAPAVSLAGLALTAFGVAFSISARLSLGANWSGVVTLKKDHELIRTGLYRSVRHPIYSGILVAMIGTALIKGHLRGCLGFAVILVTFYFKARREERFLRHEFGPGFDEHMRNTGMFLPKWT